MCHKKHQTAVIIFILCLLFNSPKLAAQQNIKKIPAEITENLQILKKAGTVEEKLNAYTELAWLYRKTNVGLAEAYSDSTIKYALILKKYPTYWLGLNSKGEALSAAGKLEKSFKVHMAALEVAESRSLTIKKAHSLNNIGLLFKKQKNYKSAREYIYKASIIYNSLNDTTGIVTTANNIGNCFYHTFIYDSAIIYYNKAIYYAGITKNLIALGNGYTNIGHCYYYMDEFQKAKKFYYQGMQYRLKAGSPGDISDSYSNNPLWYIQNNEMKEIVPDKQAIGKTENAKPFTTHPIKLSSGDSLFLFTDGFADQFGGVKGKKLKYKPFKDLLINTSMLTSNEQKQKLENDFNEWKGSLEQVDDVCIIGIRL